MPSMCVRGKSASWHREVIIVALARIKFRDKRPKIWLVTSPSSTPLHLANTAARVKSTKSLDREGKEHNALETASFCCVLDFPLEGLDKGSTCLC